MKIVHIVFEAPKTTGSGAVLRNHALKLSFSRLGQFNAIVTQEYFTKGKQHPLRKASFIEAELPQDIVTDVVRRVEEVGPDLVVVEGAYLADLARALIMSNHHVVIDMHNIESALLQETDIARRGWRAKLFSKARWTRAKMAEAALAERSAGVWVCSSHDETRLRTIAANPAPIHVVQNPIPAWCLDAQPVDIRPGIHALFVGHLSYRPNVLAAERLIRDIHPEIRKTCPDATIDICGRSPAKKLLQLAQNAPNTRIVADPVDLTPLYAQATVALIPLNSGGGTRLKVIEAMALGVPVVATHKAVEGLNLTPDKTYLHAESDAEFASAVHRLSKNQQLQRELIETGKRFAQDHHGQAAIDAAVATAMGIQS